MQMKILFTKLLSSLIFFLSVYSQPTRKGKRSILSPSEFEPSAKTKRLHGEGCKKRQDILQSQLKERFVKALGKGQIVQKL